jgi:hypothetical protein
MRSRVEYPVIRYYQEEDTLDEEHEPMRVGRDSSRLEIQFLSIMSNPQQIPGPLLDERSYGWSLRR